MKKICALGLSALLAVGASGCEKKQDVDQQPQITSSAKKNENYSSKPAIKTVDTTKRQLEISLDCELENGILVNKDGTGFVFMCNNGDNFEYELKTTPCIKPPYQDSLKFGNDYFTMLDNGIISCQLNTTFFDCPEGKKGKFVREGANTYFKCSNDRITFVCMEGNSCTYERKKDTVKK